ncbi:unnamed protein product [Dibothriocephalus latus]|uniref:Uncharacterized protein n=1 Tax=Dibothriocephalus latus TaxID=60516 RepID=A0A3P7PL53_DIBLA|nr:unnamed protein product [Dibothriocephalus latus]
MVPKDSPFADPTASLRRFADPRLQQLIERYDIHENSFHLHVNLVETHFCEDPLQSKPISSQIAAFGSVRVTLHNLNFSHYPLHLRSACNFDGSLVLTNPCVVGCYILQIHGCSQS